VKRSLAIVFIGTVVPLLLSCGGGGGGDAGGTTTAPGNTSAPGSTTTPTNNTANPSVPTPTFRVGGSVSGLNPSSGLTGTVVLALAANGTPTTNDLSVGSSGTFSFSDTVRGAQTYGVIVKSQPSGQNCSVANGTGLANGDVSNVGITCQLLRSIGGITSGLDGVAHLQLSLDGGAPVTLRVDDDGPKTATSVPLGEVFAFPFVAVQGQSYAVTVASNPLGQNCTITNGTGIVGVADIRNVGLDCTDSGTKPAYFTVGGTASVGGRGPGLRLVIDGDPGPELLIPGSGAFTFSQRLLPGQGYTVAIYRTGENCTVQNGNGFMFTANVTNVSVTCTVGVTPRYTVGGSISGLSGGMILRLSADGVMRGDMAFAANGPFSFTPVMNPGEAYKVAIVSQPTGQNCAVSNGTGVVTSTSVTNVSISCTGTGTHTVGGNVSGLSGTVQLRLSVPGLANSDLSVITNGAFTFARALTSGDGYTVSVQTQPAGQTCSVFNGSGGMGSANVSNVSVVCTTPPPVVTTPRPTLTCASTDGTDIGGLGFSGGVAYNDLNSAASTFDPSITVNYGITYSNSGLNNTSFTGSLHITMWAVTSSFNGGTINGFKIATFIPNFTGSGARSSDQLFNFATVSNATSVASGTTPPRGTYCILLTLEEFDPTSCSAADGYCYTDFTQFSNSVTF
jgi:hypothetical protein